MYKINDSLCIFMSQNNVSAFTYIDKKKTFNYFVSSLHLISILLYRCKYYIPAIYTNIYVWTKGNIFSEFKQNVVYIL